MKTHLIIYILSALAVAACSDSQCVLDNVVCLRCGFYAYGDDGQLQSVKLNDTLTVRACGTDSVLVNMDIKASALTLPMSYFNDTDTLLLEYINDGVRGRDSVFITKTNHPYYEAPDCPTNMWHVITAARSTHNAIDSVQVVKNTVNYDQDENIRIVFAAAD